MSALGPLGALGQVVSTGIGIGAANALVPPAQEIANELWRKFPDMPLAAALLAQGVAQGQIDRTWATAEALNTGVSTDRFDRLVAVFDTGPGVNYAFELWRRGDINDTAFERALKREGFEAEWIDALKRLKEVLLSSDELAMMQQQGFIDAARANEEAALQGVTPERQQLRFQVSGLPPGIERALAMLRRKIITEETFRQIVREGHEKTKYTAEELALKDQVLSAAEYAGLRLRGWLSEDEAANGGALTGYDREAMQLLYLNRGRPASPTQMRSAWAKGIDGPEGRPVDEPQFLKAIEESDVRPEYGPLLWADRHAYPSLFQLRQAVQSKALTPARALTILHYERYEDQDAQALVSAWTKGTASAGRDLTVTQLGAEYEGLFISEAEYRTALAHFDYDPAEIDQLVHLGDAARVKKWRDKTVDLVAKKFIDRSLDEAAARGDLAQAGVSDAAQGELIRLWTLDREINRKRLTAAQIKRAFTAGNLPRADAIQDLEDLGYTAEDAATYLDS